MTTETQQEQQKPKAAKPAKREKPLPGLNPSRCEGQEFARNTWLITVEQPARNEPRVEPEELLAPEYWAHIAPKLRQRDRIEAWSEDLGWYAEYLVLSVTPASARVHLIPASIQRFGTHKPEQDMILPGHTVEYAGLHAKWRVVREKDGVVLKDKCDTKGEVVGWLTDYAKAFAA